MVRASTVAVNTSQESLEQTAAPLLKETQAAFRALIDAVPGVTRRPTDLQKTLGINVSLAWQIHRFARAEDPFAESRNLPGQVAMERLLAAAIRRGVPTDVINRTTKALNAIEELGKRFASSRKEFESLLSGLAREGADPIDLTHRRAAFEAQSHLLGFRADASIGCFVRAPSTQNPSRIDAAMFRTLTGVRRFRNDASVVIASARTVHDDGSQDDTPLEPLAPVTDPRYSGLMPDFCSQPLPVVANVSNDGKSLNLELRPSGLGAESAVTCTIGHFLCGSLSRYRTQIDTHAFSITRVRMPCKLLIQDTIVYRGLFESTPPTVLTLTDHRDVDTASFNRSCDRLPGRDSAVFMGSGVEAIKLEENPQYWEAVCYTFNRMQWKIDDFDVYRVRIEYPVMPSSVFTRFDLREAPRPS